MHTCFLWVCFLRDTCVGSLMPIRGALMVQSFLSQCPKLSLPPIPAKSIDFLRTSVSGQMQSRLSNEPVISKRRQKSTLTTYNWDIKLQGKPLVNMII